MTKTPYEIRLDVLGLAQRMLEQNQIQKSNVYSSMISERLSSTSSEDLASKLEITSADILAEAEKLYTFIEGKDATSRSVGYAAIQTGNLVPPPTKNK